LIRIGLVGCVKNKRAYGSKAKDLYTSDLFMKARRYVEENYDHWHILSAKYHLVDPEAEIYPYDETLNDKTISERKAWSKRVFDQLHPLYPNPKSQVFIFHAGKRYREFIIPLLEEYGYQFEIPLEGLGIGKQLAWYKSKEELI